MADRTEHSTREGKVYGAVVLDAFSLRVVGWLISHNPTAGSRATRSGWQSSNATPAAAPSFTPIAGRDSPPGRSPTVRSDRAAAIDGLGRRLLRQRDDPDEVVVHAFSHGYREDHSTRLASYWAEAFGGPPLHSQRYGDETAVVRQPSGNGVHGEDQRAIACLDQALGDTGLARNVALKAVLHDYFAWATTTTMARYPASADDVPEGLSISRWSWDGPEI